jgi:pimeloyl-ACP methyl ester carboxylesterase
MTGLPRDRSSRSDRHENGLDERIRRWVLADERASAGPVLDAAFAEIIHVRQQRRWPWSELTESLGRPASVQLPRWAWIVVALTLAALVAVAIVAGAERLRSFLDRLTALPVTAAQLVAATCPSDLLSAPDVVCSTARVSERHGRAGVGTLSLSVIRFGAQSPSGPAVDGLLPILVFDLPDPFGEQTRVDFDRMARGAGRQVVAVAPRGTSPGDVSLACPEVEAAAPDPGAHLADANLRTAIASAVAACRERLAASGVDLAAFEPLEMAADLESVRLALGIEHWIVRARGREAPLALEVARRYPASVAGVVLVDPVLSRDDPGAIGTGDLDEALAELSTMCAADAFCAANYRPPSETFASATESLGAADVPVSIRGPSGVDVVVRVDPALLRAVVQDDLARTPAVGTLPAELDRVAAGDLQWPARALLERGWCLGSELRCSALTGWSGGAEFSIGCAADDGSDPWTLICPQWRGADRQGQFAGASGIDLPIVAIVAGASPWITASRAEVAFEGLRNSTIIFRSWAPEGIEFECLQVSSSAWYATPGRADSFICPEVTRPAFADAP